MDPLRIDAGLVDACAAHLARQSLPDYLRLVWPGYRTPPHILALCQALDDVEAGRCPRLIIAMPPRHGKSMCVSGWIARALQRAAQRYVIHISYGQDYIDGWGRKIRRILEGDGLLAYPGASVQADARAANRIELRNGSEYFAVGRGGPITGRGAHLLVIDDPLKDRQEADSDTIRKQMKDWYSEVAYTRLMPGGAVVVIATRWHEDDLSGWLLRDHAREGWRVLSLPAIAGGRDPIGRKPGEALWPEDYPLSRLEEIRAQTTNKQGPRAWSALYQQSPIPAEGSIFRVEWLKWFDDGALPSDPEVTIQSWDTAAKDRDINDFTVGQTWQSIREGYAMVGQRRGHWDFPTQENIITAYAQQFGPSAVLIEDKGTGTALLASLRAKTRLPLIAVDPGQRSKVVRAQAVSPSMQSGRIWFPRGQPWVNDLLAEIAAFPAVSHDDQVDAMTQAVEYLRDLRPSTVDDRNKLLASIPIAGSM